MPSKGVTAPRDSRGSTTHCHNRLVYELQATVCSLSCYREYLVGNAVPATTALIVLQGSDHIYHKVKTNYADPGATATIISSDGSLEKQTLVPVLNTVPYPCEMAGEYTVEYEFLSPSCQCCSCRMQQFSSQDQSVRAQRTVIVCKYTICTINLTAIQQICASCYFIVQTIRYHSTSSVAKWCGTSKARLTLTVEQSPRLVTVMAYDRCNTIFRILYHSVKFIHLEISICSLKDQIANNAYLRQHIIAKSRRSSFQMITHVNLIMYPLTLRTYG